MQKRTTVRTARTAVFILLAALILGPTGIAYQTDEELKKKYAPILGSYEFDMTDFGMGVLTVEIYVEYGSLWAFPDNSDSAGEMIAVEGKEFVFKIEDANEGTYEINFIKDEEGNYSKCHVVNEFAGMDVTGNKIKK